MTNPVDAWNDRDGLRWYTHEGADYLSVTSMRKALGMPHPLHAWTLNQLMDGVLDDPTVVETALAKESKEMERRVKHRDGSVEDDEAAIIRSRKAARTVLRALSTDKRDKSASRGTDVHEAIATGKPTSELDPELKPYVEQYAKAVIEMGIQPLMVERQVFNKTMGYAGSFDLLARLAKVAGSPIAVIDLKTGANTYGEHALQGYSYFKGEFVAESGVIDTAATEVLKSASQVGVLRIGPEDWEYHDVRIDKSLHSAWYATCLLSHWLINNPSLKTLENR